MEKQKNIEHGLKWGIIIGVVYCLLLLLRYSQGANPVMLGLWTFVGFVVVVILLAICGVTRRRQLGGYIDLKDAFQTMFIAVLGYEFFYMAFNFIYLKYVNPDFFLNMKLALEEVMVKSNMPQDQIDKTLEQMDTQAAKNLNLGSSFLSFMFAVMLSGIVALILALIIRRKRLSNNPFEQAPQ